MYILLCLYAEKNITNIKTSYFSTDNLSYATVSSDTIRRYTIIHLQLECESSNRRRSRKGRGVISKISIVGCKIRKHTRVISHVIKDKMDRSFSVPSLGFY